jgi:hypothetical protein
MNSIEHELDGLDNDWDDDWYEEDRPCSISATINPKLLTGIDDYVNASDASCLTKMIEAFNYRARDISPLLKDFGSYSLNRIDYCINFNIDDFGVCCFPSLYMILIKRGDIPAHFEEYKKYDTVSHRMKGVDSYYVTNNSLTINCYDKHAQLVKQYPDTPNIGYAFNIIRFEIQCKYLKSYNMMKRLEYINGFEDKIAFMLSDDFCRGVLESYYYKTIGRGDYYTLVGAKKIIMKKRFNKNKEDRLIHALELVSKSHSVYKVKSRLYGTELDKFKTTLKDLGDIGINPVTIPRGCSVTYAPNLLTAHISQIERMEKACEESRAARAANRNRY